MQRVVGKLTGGLKMEQSEQQEHLENELNAVIRRFISEYQLTFGSVVGVLELVKADLIYENFKKIEREREE